MLKSIQVYSLCFKLAKLGLVGFPPKLFFWLLVLIVLFVFYCIKNYMMLISTEEKEKLMNKNLYILVLSFFEAVSTGIMGLVVNSIGGTTPLT